MISPDVIYLELVVALFFLPGFFITTILGIKKFRFLLSFALSYSLLVLTLLPFEYYAQPIVRWQLCVLGLWVALAVGTILKIFTGDNSKHSIRTAFGNDGKLFSRSAPRVLVPLVLAGVVCGYLTYAGAYLEIPSDAWRHIFKFQLHKLVAVEQGSFPSPSSFPSLFFTQGSGSHWYFIHAWLCHVSELPIMDSPLVLTFLNVLIFLLAIYYFGLYLFAGLRIGTFKKMVMAALASLFAAATMGNMVFAYIRYYAFAPTILNYVIFLAAMAVIMDWLRSTRIMGHALWIAPLLIITAVLIHTQESLFIYFMTLALSTAQTVRIIWRMIMSRQLRYPWRQAETTKILPTLIPGHSAQRKELNLPPPWKQGEDHNHCSVKEWKAVILTAGLLMVFFSGFAATRYFKPDAWISAYMILPNVGIPPEPVNFIFRNLMISPPHNPWLRLAAYQIFIFYPVVGCWGLFVYMLFIMMIRLIQIPYLMAGIIIVPLLTAFNPLMIDMMARMRQDAALYRFLYMIPLPFVAGYLFVLFLGKAQEWFHSPRAAPIKSASSFRPRRSWIKFVGSILILSGLIGLVFPINTAGIYAPYSKIYTLRKMPPANDYQLCNDLGKIVSKYENKVILTDSWTSGILWFYSPKNTYCHVKWLNSSNPENEPPEPYTWEELRNCGLIIVNRRNGGLSITGKIAKHWPEDILPQVSRNYSIRMQTYLESHPKEFPKIWTQNRIAVYAVRR